MSCKKSVKMMEGTAWRSGMSRWRGANSWPVRKRCQGRPYNVRSLMLTAMHGQGTTSNSDGPYSSTSHQMSDGYQNERLWR